MDLLALRQYFMREWVSSAPNPYADWVYPESLHPLQYRWLGLGCEIAIQEQLLACQESPDLNSSQHKMAELKRQRAALAMLLKIKKLDLPDEAAWRHPELPYGFQETYERYCLAYPRENRAEMNKKTVSQTGEGQRKKRKGRRITPRKARIKNV